MTIVPLLIALRRLKTFRSNTTKLQIMRLNERKSLALTPPGVAQKTFIDGTITLRGNAIIMDHIKDGNIVGRHIKDASVNSSKFNSSSVTSRSLATEAVTSQKIVDGTVKPVDFAPGSINGDHIQSTTVTSRELGDPLHQKPWARHY